MNLFSTDVYLQTLAEVYFPGRERAIELFEVEGKIFRMLVIDGKQVIRTWPYFDFVQPLESAPSGPKRPLDYLPWAVLRTTRSEQKFDAGTSGRRPSPFIDWSLFPDWAAFEAGTSPNWSDSRRRMKKLEKDLGPVAFTFDDPAPDAFEMCLRWKSSQYLASGYADLTSDPQHVAMFQALRTKNILKVTSLRAGPQLLAVHLGALYERRLYWWVPAYDVSMRKYSPGRILLESLLAESLRQQHLEFDFLIGDEEYKWHYATHNREIGPLGQPPLSLRVQQEAKRRIKGALSRFPRALDLARDLKKRLTR